MCTKHGIWPVQLPLQPLAFLLIWYHHGPKEGHFQIAIPLQYVEFLTCLQKTCNSLELSEKNGCFDFPVEGIEKN